MESQTRGHNNYYHNDNNDNDQYDDNMMKAHLAYLAAIEKDWDVWRKYYDNFTIDDLVWLNTAISKHFSEQACFDISLIGEVFDLLNVPFKYVLELGCYQGFLAEKILRQRTDVSVWVGYDINHYAISETRVEDKRYHAFKMTEWLWNVVLPVEVRFNVFVSSHTLEHLNEMQILRVFTYIFTKRVQYAVVAMPFNKNQWIGYNGSHVYRGSKKDFVELVKTGGYTLLAERPHGVMGFELAQ